MRQARTGRRQTNRKCETKESNVGDINLLVFCFLEGLVHFWKRLKERKGKKVCHMTPLISRDTLIYCFFSSFSGKRTEVYCNRHNKIVKTDDWLEKALECKTDQFVFVNFSIVNFTNRFYHCYCCSAISVLVLAVSVEMIKLKINLSIWIFFSAKI